MDADLITFGLPAEVERMLLDGCTISKCRDVLKNHPGYEDKSSSELRDMLLTAHTYLTAETSAREFERDFDYYQISPAMDDNTCKYCKEISNRKFKFSEREPGKNFPPLHNGCRCTITVSVNNWNNWMDNHVAKQITSSRKAGDAPVSKIYYDKTVLICCIFGGWFGLHRYMRKQIGMGLLYTFTAGLFCIGWIADIIVEATRPKK